MHIRDLRRIRPMLDFKTASTIATSIVHSKVDYCNSLFLNLDYSQIHRLQLIQNSLVRAVTRTPRHDHITRSCPQITSLAKNPRAHPLQSPVPNLQFPAVFPAHVPSPTLHHPANPLYSIIILSHPFSTPRSLLISCSPTEPYPSLHHVFGMTYHQNFTPFLCLHHRHCQS